MANFADDRPGSVFGIGRLKPASLLLTTVLVLSACGSGTSTAGDTAPVTPEEAYARRCSGCHGVLGSDQAARSLPNLETLTTAEIEAIVLSGAVGMPAFAEFVEREEIDAIVAYVDGER